MAALGMKKNRNFAKNLQKMTINFQRHSLRFLAPDEPCPAGSSIDLDDSDLRRCFEALATAGHDLVARFSEGGMRRLVQYVNTHYINVKAAGGIVTDDRGHRLLMVRNDRADLPKGKVEAGETLAQAAVRETEEETGLRNISLGSLLLKTYHIYDLYGGWHFKQTSWFVMHVDGNQTLVPQTEEGITAIRWVEPYEWQRQLHDSYATMRIIASQTAENTVFESIR